MDDEPLRLREPAHRVSPRARWMWRAEAGIEAAIVIGAAVLAPWLWDDVPSWSPALAIPLGVAWAIGLPEWRYRVHRWETTDTAVYTQSGWWAIEQRIAPMSRVQTVDLTEGLLARLFGLATVTVTTASAAGALTIAGLDRRLARELVERLTRRAEAEGGDAT
ncbi:PH domain-containing protein [Nocardioides sp. R-C-SC26]|uniref:PH domain-containing protein n=1 Tax=Nocardioides sp. R-C-SC26 TaxID=2870414 RepID=UPI001E60E6A2|nr:PH domain-containing protein [Nocardioides sp. R-C-SC26]